MKKSGSTGSSKTQAPGASKSRNGKAEESAVTKPANTETAPSAPNPSQGESRTELSPSLEFRKVSIEFFHPEARDIFVAASFNDWNPTATRLTPLGGGKWSIELSLKPGAYEYRLVVDGVWTDDPMSAESAPNPFAGFNSVLRVDALPG